MKDQVGAALPESNPYKSNAADGDQGSRALRLCELATALFAAIPVLLFLAASFHRLHYPYLLEQLEGPMLLAAERVAHGLPIYVRPNFTFIPYMYAPAYYYVSGWMVRWLGASFFPLRLLSLLSACASFAVIYSFVFFDAAGTRTRRHLAALAGVALYASMYPWTRTWFDLARLDSFYVLLLLLALLCTRRLHPVLAAAAWTLAFLAKQTVLPLGLIMLCWDWKRPRRMLLGTGSLLLMAAIATRLLDHATHGWFWFYAFTVPHANTDLLVRPVVFFLPSQVFAPCGIALIVVALAWDRTAAGWSGENCGANTPPPKNFYLLAGLSTLVLCWFLQAHGGATSNTPMPFYATLAIIFGISFARLDAWLARKSGRGHARMLLLGAVAIQVVSWAYNPHNMAPPPGLAASHRALSAWMRSFPGDVFVPASPYEAALAGKSWHPDIAAIHDALRSGDPQINRPLLAEIAAAIDGERFDAIALDGVPAQALRDQPWLPTDTMRHYPVVGLVPGGQVGDYFAPHPIYFLLPCREQARAVQQGWALVQTRDRLPCPLPDTERR
jgi:hypothetical protein